MDIDHAPVIGPMGPRPDGLDAPYWDGLADGRLVLQRCESCREWIWGPQVCCPYCRRLDPGWEPTPMRGRVYSWTRTWQKFTPELADSVPYVTVVVELAEAGGRRVVGLLLGDDTQDPRIGEDVAGVVQAASELTGGQPILRWQRA